MITEIETTGEKAVCPRCGKMAAEQTGVDDERYGTEAEVWECFECGWSTH